MELKARRIIISALVLGFAILIFVLIIVTLLPGLHALILRTH